MKPTRSIDNEHWSLAIFSSRERATQLQEVVLAASAADRGGATLTIDLIVNGNPTLADAMQSYFAVTPPPQPGVSVGLWSVSEPDKATAWNTYLHTLMPVSDLAFFMDGYITVDRTALLAVANALRREPGRLAATCIPSTGRSAPRLRQQLLTEGGFHGNLYAFPPVTCKALREMRVRLPAGIYRNDSVLGAVLAFNFDPQRYSWRWDRIAVVPEARYQAPVPSLLRLADWKGALKRRLRQARGQLENNAIRAHLAVNRQLPGTWPSTVRALILGWAHENKAQARALLWRDPLAWAALQRLRGDTPSPPRDAGAQFLGSYWAGPAGPPQRVCDCLVPSCVQH